MKRPQLTLTGLFSATLWVAVIVSITILSYQIQQLAKVILK